MDVGAEDITGQINEFQLLIAITINGSSKINALLNHQNPQISKKIRKYCYTNNIGLLFFSSWRTSAVVLYLHVFTMWVFIKTKI